MCTLSETTRFKANLTSHFWIQSHQLRTTELEELPLNICSALRKRKAVSRFSRKCKLIQNFHINTEVRVETHDVMKSARFPFAILASTRTPTQTVNPGRRPASVHVPMSLRAMHCLKAGSVAPCRRQTLCSSLNVSTASVHFL